MSIIATSHSSCASIVEVIMILLFPTVGDAKSCLLYLTWRRCLLLGAELIKKYLALSTYLRIWKKSVLVPAILFRILPGHRFFIVAGPRAKSCQAEFGRRRFNDRRRRGHLHPPTSPSNPIITIHQLHPRAQFLQGRGRFPCHLWIRRGMGAALGNAAPKFLFETGGVDLTSKYDS